MVGDHLRRRAKRWLSPWLFELGRWAGRLTIPNSYLIITFHRVTPFEAIGPFDHTVWSGSPVVFAEMLRFLKRHFVVISCDELVHALGNRRRLPLSAALVTFDDGYRDTSTYAFPILKQEGLSATVFVTTNVIDQADELLWTDRLAYACHTTTREVLALPWVGGLPLTTPACRRAAFVNALMKLKGMAEEEKRRRLDEIIGTLRVTFPPKPAAGLYLSSEDIQQMSRDGVTFGSHTCSHAILSRVNHARARREVFESKTRLEDLLGRPVISFAYPNGLPEDYTDATIALLREAGFQLAVTTIPGVNRLNGTSDPFQLRRLHGGHCLSDLRYVTGMVALTAGRGGEA